MRDDSYPPRPAPKIGITTNQEDLATASELARQLEAPLIRGNASEFDCVLHFSGQRLEISMPHEPALVKAVGVEFVEGAFGYRRRQSGREPLLRAVGLKKDYRPRVLDATAGLGRDGFLLAMAGCRVTMCERSRIVAALLADGLRRAGHTSAGAEIVARIELVVDDAASLLQRPGSCGGEIEVVYLDPMFPGRTKAAKVKKELQLLQLLLGPDHDTGPLFAAALQVARHRVVVKRPVSAPPLPDALGRKPSHSVTGKTTRFDVYLCQR